MQCYSRQAEWGLLSTFVMANHWVLFHRRGSRRRQCWCRKTRRGKEEEEQEGISTFGRTETRLSWPVSLIVTTHLYCKLVTVIPTTLRTRRIYQEHGNIDNTGLSTTREYHQEYGISEHGNIENTEKKESIDTARTTRTHDFQGQCIHTS